MFTSRRIVTSSGGDKFRDEKSLAFDGSDDYVMTDFRPDYIHTNATIAFWIKMNDFSSSQVMGIHNNKRWYFGFNGTDLFIGVADAHNSGSLITPSPALVTGQWFHYCVTAIGGTATVYINGIAQGTMSYTQSSSTNPSESTKGFSIGGRNDTSGVGAEMHGNISEVVNYDVGLTASQVKTIYNGREPYNHKEGVASGNLKAWHRMGDGTFDDYAIITDEANATKSSELSPNVTFDTNTTGWSSYSDGDANTLSRDTTIKHSGSGSLKIVFGASNGGWAAKTTGDISSVNTNKLLVMEGWVYIPSGSYNGGHPFLTDGSGFSNASIEGVTYASSSITDQWQFMRTVATLTSDSNGRCYVYTTGTDPSENDIIYVDDIKIYQINGNAGTMVNMIATNIEGDTP